MIRRVVVRALPVVAVVVAGTLAATPAHAASHLVAAPTITSVTPAAGPVGSTITVAGTNLAGATAVTVGGVPVSRITSDTATRVVAVVGPSPSGPVAVTTAGGTATGGPFTVVPGVVVTPARTHPQGTITVTAGGFDPYSSADVYLGTTDVLLTTTNGNGVATATLTVPAAALPGAQWVTVDERANHRAAQASFVVGTDWTQNAYGAGGAGWNPYETALTSGNVGQLDTLWTGDDGQFGNATPLVEQNGTVFAGDYTGTIRAYSAAGVLTWTASLGAGNRLDYHAPVIHGTTIYFGGGTVVAAFKTTCGTHGATCTPLWTATVAVGVSSGLTYANGTVYAPGGDAQVYPVDPTTGAVGTPFHVYDTTDGAITTPVTFSADGHSYYYVTSTDLHYATPTGTGFTGSPNNISAVAAVAGAGYYTSSDGVVHQLNGWTATTSGTFCYPPPAVAGGYVYAGGCSTLAAYGIGTGAVRWQVATTAAVQGVTVANGVVYACVGNRVRAFDAGSGAALWAGGRCSSAPTVANGVVFSALGVIEADVLPSQYPNQATRPAPAVDALRPDPRLRAVASR